VGWIKHLFVYLFIIQFRCTFSHSLKRIVGVTKSHVPAGRRDSTDYRADLGSFPGPTVFCELWNFELSFGICPFPWNFDISVGLQKVEK